MKLADVRRLTIRNHYSIRFQMQNGRECVVNAQGIAQVPGWTGTPDFNLEQELAAAGEFLLDPVTPGVRARKLSRAELTALTDSSPVAAAAPDHDDD